MKTKSLFGGLIILLIGLILLANNFGFLSWRVWGELWRLWPLILIAIGLDLLFRGTSFSFLRILPPLLIIGGVCFMVYLSETGKEMLWFERRRTETIILTQPLPSTVKEVAIEIDFGAGTLKVESNSIQELARGKFIISKEIKPWMKYREKKGEGFLEIGSYFPYPESRENSWEIKLNNTIPLSLKIDTGASDNSLDLSSLRITELELNAGASKNRIKLGKESSLNVKISGGASTTEIFIPRSMGVRIETDMALATHNFDTLNFEKKGDIYLSKNYWRADKRVDLDLDIGVSTIKIKLY